MIAVHHIASRAAAVALLALAAAGMAFAQSNTSAEAPFAKAASAATLRLAPGAARAVTVAFEPPDAALVAAVRKANTVQHEKRLRIGIGRAAQRPEASSAALAWQAVPGGFAAHWEVLSPGARALRVGLVAARLAPGTELRFAGYGALSTVYGPATSQELVPGGPIYWSPVLEGERAIVEVFVPGVAVPSGIAFEIAQLSHLFVSPADPKADSLAKAADVCEVDLACRSASDPELAQTGRAVARMAFSDGSGGDTFLCTGTLLNPLDNSFTPYFYSAYHCINTQAAASTLTTYWFYDATSCGSGVTSPLSTQLPGGATLLYANQASDGLLVRLNATPPSGAVYAGWDASTVPFGTALTAIHHPAGDLKKVSLGSMVGFGNYDIPSLANYLIVGWNSVATGVTERGSSGSGIFTNEGSGYKLRGGLKGGPSSCTASASELRDYYSRFDQVYPSVAAWLNPASGSCSYALSSTGAVVVAGASTGSFTVSTSGGCSWTATSNALWLTTSGSGSGSGMVPFSVAANSDASARTGTISVGCQSFTVTQAAGAASDGANVIANPGFESGTASWTQQADTGTIITNVASNAHAGSWYAWLGGYTGGTDILAQDIAIPAGSAALRFWYAVATKETSSSTAYDTFTVRLVNRSTGTTLATLASLSNLDATLGWVQSPTYDVSAYAGQTVRLVFTATNDVANSTSFLIDDVALTASATANYTSLWWNPSESGWGLNVNHQGDIVFATLFTYDTNGTPMWLVMSRGDRQGTSDTYSGPLFRASGPRFDANPFPAAHSTQVGTMTIAFSGDSASLTYSVNGIAVTKAIRKEDFPGMQAASCVGTTADRTGLAQYQDLWWNANEPGWGLNITQQKGILFGTLFTYDSNGQGAWLVLSRGERQADGSFAGDLYTTTGPRFDASPFNPAQVVPTKVGTMSLRFANGTSGTLTYSYNGTTVTKAITREEFSSPLPACSG